MRPEHRTILLLLALAATGHATRRLLTRPAEAPGAIRLLAPSPSQSAAAQRATTARLARPLTPGERIKVNEAPAEEIARLPRIGPSLARRIVADRERQGPFGSLAALDRVPGVGPGVLKEVEPWVDFSPGRRAPRGRVD